MKKNGFTMIELIAIVVVLAAIVLVSVPALIKTVQKSKERSYNDFLDNIYIAAENYITLNSDDYNQLNYENGAVFLTLGELISNGYIKSSLKNPQTETTVSREDTVKVTKDDTGLKFNYFQENRTTSGYAQDGLILHYDGYSYIDDVWKDLSKRQNDGTMVNFSKANGNGWVGNGVKFVSSTSNHIDLGNKIADLFYFSNTIEFVIKFDNNNTRTVLIGNHPMTNSINIEKGYSNRQGRIYYGGGSISNYFTANSFFNLGVTETTSYALDKTKGTFSFYNNGNFFDKTTTSGFSNSYEFDSAKIGSDGRSGNNVVTLGGTLYSVRIYNRVLSEEELQKNNNVDRARFDF